VQAMGTCDEHDRTTNAIASCRERRLGIAGELQRPPAGVPHATPATASQRSGFAGLVKLVPYADINEFFTTDYRARRPQLSLSASEPSQQEDRA
jgi:hypothetical protein